MDIKSDFNDDIRALISRIYTSAMVDYVGEVDWICARYVNEISGVLDDVPARLFLLKLANLLVANYECSHRHFSLISHPVGLLVDPTNGCGLSCPGCVHSGATSTWDWPSGQLKPNVYKSFIDEHGPFAVEIYLANYGEPMLSALTPQFVRLARQYGLPTFTSSSLSVPGKLMDGVVESGLNFLICSIDGATEHVYQRYRRGGNLHQVIANLTKLVETKRRLGSYTPVLHWQFLVFEHNRHEVDAVIELARDLGVNELALVKPFDVTWDDPTIRAQADWESRTIIFDYSRKMHNEHLGRLLNDLAPEAVRRHFACSWSDRLASKPEIADEIRERRRSRVRSKTCNWLYKSITMDGHGRIMPCARPPALGGDLIFSKYTDKDHFSSPMHKLARQAIVDLPGYEENVRTANVVEPYCVGCRHRDQKGDIDTHVTVRRILRDASLYNMLDDESVVALTDW